MKRITRIQFVWWWHVPTLRRWAYPRSYKTRPVFGGVPIFWGLDLGIVEVRVFPVRPIAEKPNYRQAEGVLPSDSELPEDTLKRLYEEKP